MKTIYLSVFLVLATAFSLQAQFLYDESIEPFANSYFTSSENYLFGDELNFGTAYSPFAMQASPFASLTPSEDWLMNRFGTAYAGDPYDDWLNLPQSSLENGLKIPIGNGIIVLIVITGLYGAIIIFRKKLR